MRRDLWIWLEYVQQHIHVLNLFTVITGSTGAHCLCCWFRCILRRKQKAASTVLKSATLSGFCICGWLCREGIFIVIKVSSSSGSSASLFRKIVDIFSPMLKSSKTCLWRLYFPVECGCQEFNLWWIQLVLYDIKTEFFWQVCTCNLMLINLVFSGGPFLQMLEKLFYADHSGLFQSKFKWSTCFSFFFSTLGW